MKTIDWKAAKAEVREAVECDGFGGVWRTVERLVKEAYRRGLADGGDEEAIVRNGRQCGKTRATFAALTGIDLDAVVLSARCETLESVMRDAADAAEAIGLSTGPSAPSEPFLRAAYIAKILRVALAKRGAK